MSLSGNNSATVRRLETTSAPDCKWPHAHQWDWDVIWTRCAVEPARVDHRSLANDRTASRPMRLILSRILIVVELQDRYLYAIRHGASSMALFCTLLSCFRPVADPDILKGALSPISSVNLPRTFAVAGPRAWNILPPALRSTSKLFSSSKTNLNRFLLDSHFLFVTSWALTMLSHLVIVRIV